MPEQFCRFKPTLLILRSDETEKYFLIQPSKIDLFPFSSLHSVLTSLPLNKEAIETIFHYIETSSSSLRNNLTACVRNAYYWITKATYYESIGESEMALKTYESCTRFDPQPIEALTLSFRYFLLRLNESLPDRLDDGEDDSADELPNDMPKLHSIYSGSNDVHAVVQQTSYCDSILDRIEQLDEELLNTSTTLYSVPGLTSLGTVTEGESSNVNVPSIPFTPSKLVDSPALKRIQQERKIGNSPLMQCKRKLFHENESETANKFQKQHKSDDNTIHSLPNAFEYDDGGFDFPLQQTTANPLTGNNQSIIKQTDSNNQNVAIKYSLMRTPKKIHQLTQTPLILSPVKRIVRTPQPASKRNDVFDSLDEIPADLTNYYYIPNETLTGGKTLKASTVLGRFLQESQENDQNETTAANEK